MVYKPYGGHVPNFADRSPAIIATAAVAITVTTLSVLVRLWSRLVATRTKFWWDDAALLMTLLFSNAYLATMIWWTTIGYGKHMYMLPMSGVNANMLAVHLIITWYIAAINFLKLAALTLYGRLFRISRGMVYTLWGVGVIVILWWIASELLPWLSCRPIEKTIHPLMSGECLERIGYYRAVGLINPLLDIIILLLPMPIIWKLHLSTQRKLLVSMIFILGYSSAFLSLARFVIIFINPHILSAGTPKSDPTWDTVPLQIISMLEAPVAIIALCGPPINQIMHRVKQFGWQSLFSTARYPTQVVDSESDRYKPSKSESESSFYGKKVRKNERADSMPRMPSLDMRILSSGSNESRIVHKDQSSSSI